MQYNARNEFFQTNIFKPNVECMDRECIANQKRVKDGNIDTIGQREAMIKAKKAEKAKEYVVDEEEMKKWSIDIVDESGEREQAEAIDVKKRDETTMEELMKQMQQL